MSDTSQIVRQWLILRTLSTRRNGVTLKELAGESRCSLKTIRRDLQLLHDLGFPLSESTGDFGRKHWRMESHAGPPSIAFTLTEALSLYLGRQLLEPLAGTYLWEGAQSAFRKIRAGLSEQACRYLDQIKSAFAQTTFGASDKGDQAAIVDALIIGLEDRRRVRLLYHPLRLDVPASYEVDPHGLIYHRGSLYLVAFAPRHGEMRHYKVDRIRDAEVLADQPFERQADFDLRQHLQGTLAIYHHDVPAQRVRIRFCEDAARHVQEHRWHATQKLTANHDGSVTLELELSALTEVRSWVLGFGAKATVEEPESLRADIAAELSAALQAYATEARPRTDNDRQLNRETPRPAVGGDSQRADETSC